MSCIEIVLTVLLLGTIVIQGTTQLIDAIRSLLRSAEKLMKTIEKSKKIRKKKSQKKKLPHDSGRNKR